MTGKRVSIILVNWNGKQWLDRCISSLLDQDYPHIEIVLVDNGSTDDSVEHTEQTFRAVRVIRTGENLGFSRGVNAGVRAASGDMIMLLNTDTWVKPGLVSHLLEAKARIGLDVVGPREAQYDGAVKDAYVSTIDVLGHAVYLEEGSGHQNFYLSGVCLLFDKALYLESGGLDPNFFMYFEEIDWLWRLRLQGKRYGYIDDAFVYHAGAGSTGVGIKYKSFLWRNQNCLQMLLKNYSASSLTWALPLYLVQNVFEASFFLLIFKPSITKTYFLGWWFNLKHLRRTLAARSQVQKSRAVGEREILDAMYKGPGKLVHLLQYARGKS